MTDSQALAAPDSVPFDLHHVRLDPCRDCGLTVTVVTFVCGCILASDRELPMPEWDRGCRAHRLEVVRRWAARDPMFRPRVVRSGLPVMGDLPTDRDVLPDD